MLRGSGIISSKSGFSGGDKISQTVFSHFLGVIGFFGTVETRYNITPCLRSVQLAAPNSGLFLRRDSDLRHVHANCAGSRVGYKQNIHSVFWQTGSFRGGKGPPTHQDWKLLPRADLAPGGRAIRTPERKFNSNNQLWPFLKYTTSQNVCLSEKPWYVSYKTFCWKGGNHVKLDKPFGSILYLDNDFHIRLAVRYVQTRMIKERF